MSHYPRQLRKHADGPKVLSTSCRLLRKLLHRRNPTPPKQRTPPALELTKPRAVEIASQMPIDTPSYIDFLPKMIKPYVKKALNVELDGHCGFWVISFGLGCGQQEFDKICAEFYNHIKENMFWYNPKPFFFNINSLLKRIKFKGRE
jgi:hypothetical protein